MKPTQRVVENLHRSTLTGNRLGVADGDGMTLLFSSSIISSSFDEAFSELSLMIGLYEFGDFLPAFRFS